jgi:hypothetical protein
VAKKPIRPVIVVEAIPGTVARGQTISISARLFDKDTMQPMEVSRIYMTITSMTDGHIVWPLEVVRKDADGFDIMIGTEDMKQDHEYLLRVSNNWNLSPSASTTFLVEKKSSILPIIPLLPLIPLILLPDTNIQDLLKSPDGKPLKQVISPEGIPEPFLVDEAGTRYPIDLFRKVKEYIFRTQMDHRVCPKCKPFENRVFQPEDDIPIIPIHHQCRCTMDVIYFDPGMVTAELRKIASVARVWQKTEIPRQAIKIINRHYY